MPRQLGNGGRGEQAGDQGHEDGQREAAPGERGAGRDRGGDGRAGGHRGDALEEDFSEADRVTAEGGSFWRDLVRLLHLAHGGLLALAAQSSGGWWR